MHARLGIALSICLTTAAWAGGPFYPDAVAALSEARRADLLHMPVAVIGHEVRGLIPREAPKYDLKRGVDCDAAAADDLREALAGSDLDVEALVRLQASVRSGGPYVGVKPVGMPAEFDLYLRGVEAERMGLHDAARAAWRAVFDLPADGRRFRGVWAAYRLGRSWQDVDPDEAARWLALARTCADAGGVDSVGLAAASIGWEARAHLDAGRIERAVALYLQQAAFDRDSAILSLHHVAARVVDGDRRALLRVARDEATRTVVTAYVLGRVAWSTPWDRQIAAEWLGDLDEAGILDEACGDRLAWAAYDEVDWPGSRRWLSRAGDGEPFANWLRAEKLLRAGDRAAAADLLQQACDRGPSMFRCLSSPAVQFCSMRPPDR